MKFKKNLSILLGIIILIPSITAFAENSNSNYPVIIDSTNTVTNEQKERLINKFETEYPNTDLSNFTLVYSEKDSKYEDNFTRIWFDIYFKNVLVYNSSGYADANVCFGTLNSEDYIVVFSKEFYNSCTKLDFTDIISKEDVMSGELSNKYFPKKPNINLIVYHDRNSKGDYTTYAYKVDYVNDYESGYYIVDAKTNKIITSQSSIIVEPITTTTTTQPITSTIETSSTTQFMSTTTTTNTTTTKTTSSAGSYVIYESEGYVEIANKPNKTVYKVGEEIDLTGLTVSLYHYPGGTIFVPNPDEAEKYAPKKEVIYDKVSPFDYPDVFVVDISDFDNNTVGTYNIGIHCTNETGSKYMAPLTTYFTVEVVDNETKVTTENTTTTNLTTTTVPTTTTNTDVKAVTQPQNTITQVYGIKINLQASDPNNDNSIDSADATCILIDYANRLAESKNYKYYTLDQADSNDDGKVDSADATIILIYYANEMLKK